MSSTKLALTEVSRRSSLGLDPKVKRHMDQMISPILGPVRKLTSLIYDAASPTLFTFLPELSDIHRRTGLSTALQYHLGGYGFSPEEALMRALGESVERAAQVTFHISNSHLMSKYSHHELAASHTQYLPIYDLAPFTLEQRKHPRFPLATLEETTPISWVPGINLRNDTITLLPAQAIITGFTGDEPRAVLAVSTGTGAHTSYGRALSSALLELLQIDAAVGHWYSHSTAPRIEISASSTPRFARFLAIHDSWLRRAGGQLEFYWLRQPGDLPVYTVACAIHDSDRYPALSLGLGVAIDLEDALYSALIEAIPVSYVAMINGMTQLYGASEAESEGPPKRRASDLRTAYRQLNPSEFTDFDNAVGFYAIPENADTLFPKRFNPNWIISGSEIRQQIPSLPQQDKSDQVVKHLLPQVLQHHRLYAFDMSAIDSLELGFYVVRFYSPDLLPLCAPSFPVAGHPRFNDYGGFRSSEPHPYP